ncbi:SDR family oxidoreductase [Atopococcus tabaci]|uniref:SDR family oxidoreductase n=2 Tax=Atopococcus tabaci TaxID=269774 RepID=UPI0003F71ADD|nr:SDR family oxidoreductase [Atopococcus tabaci]
MFKDKTAVVTGGAHGIGKAVVKGFLAHSAKVAFIDQDKEAGASLKKELEKAGEEVLFFHGDLADPKTLREFVQEVHDTYGDVTYLINNAMETKGGILSNCSYEDFVAALKVGVAAPYELTRLLLSHFTEGASVVNISSSRAFQSQADTESYTAAKGGISALTHSLAVSLSGKVRVNAISPGWIETTESPVFSQSDLQQHPSGHVGTPEDVVRLVLFLCDENNRFINGENILIDGGMSKRMIYHDDEGWTYTSPQK